LTEITLEKKPKLPGFFTYDFLATDILIGLVKNSRDLDSKEALKTGEYGSNYQTLLRELNTIEE